MPRRPYWLSITVLAVLLLLLSACQGDDGDDTADTDGDTAEADDTDTDDGDDTDTDDGDEGDDGDVDTSYFEGETIRFIIPNPPGGGTDTISRFIGTNIAQYIPGEPTIAYENMPGGGGLIAANYLANQEPDGLTLIPSLSGGAVVAGVTGEEDIEYALDEYTWIGNFVGETAVLWGRTELGYETWEDVVNADEPLSLAAESPSHPTSLWAKGVQFGTGVDFNHIYGYDGSAEAMLDVERGHVDGRAASWSSLLNSYPEMEDQITPYVVIGRERSQLLPDVVTLPEIAVDGTEAYVEATVGPMDLSRAMVGPAGMDADATQILQDAYQAMTADEEFREEAENLGYEVLEPTGDELAETARNMIADEEIREAMRTLVEAE